MRYLLDLIYLVAFAVFYVLSILRPKQYKASLHAFNRNFWGRIQPECDGRPVVWLHAVSVGESLICGPLLRRLGSERPDLQFVLSVGTCEGFVVASGEFREFSIFYAPADFSWAIAQTFDRLRPLALMIAENDFWPNMLNEARRRSIPLAIFNTRFTHREIAEHRWNSWLLRPGLIRAQWWGAVAESDAAWIRHFFPVTSPPLEVTGSLKCDGILRDCKNPRTEQFRQQFGFGPSDRVLVAGSTHDAEELWLTEIVRSIAMEFPRIRLVLVPRNVWRCETIIAELQQCTGVDFVLASQLSPRSPGAAMVTLVDSTGCLRDIWGVGEFAFVGGSLVPRGGHNMVEPASYGIPVCFGPHVEDFQGVADDLIAAGGAVQVRSANAAAALIRHWLANPDEVSKIGQRAREFVGARRDVLDRTTRGLLTAIPNAAGLSTPNTSASPKRHSTEDLSVDQIEVL